MLFTSANLSTVADATTLADIEHEVASGVRRLRFKGALEARYQADTRQRRLQFLTSIGISGAVVYNLFILSDWLSLHDVFGYVAMGRLCLITPMIIGFLLLARRLSSRCHIEILSATGTIMASLMPLVVMMYSDSPYQLHYQLGMLLLMVYCTMIQQLPFVHATVSMLLMLAILLITTHLAGFMDPVTWRANALLYSSTVLLLLMASYFLERGTRMSYLFLLKGKLLQAQLFDMARIDPLTQLFNRRYQGEVTSLVWEQAQAEPLWVTAILIDVDHFKMFNDSYGHMQGDSCLKSISDAVRQVAEAAGAVSFRFGGEELLVLKVGGDMQWNARVAEHLRDAVWNLRIPHPKLGDGECVTISVGVASALAPTVTADALLGAADQALYQAKAEGRNCWRLHAVLPLGAASLGNASTVFVDHLPLEHAAARTGV